MNNNIMSTIDSLKEQLKPLPVSREDYLALCVKNRLEQQSQFYDKEFKKLLGVLEREYFSETKISKLTKSLKIYSQTSAILYKGLLRQLKSYNKNLLVGDRE